MSELHLDLCRLSTRHLNDTIDSLKESLRMLEVFINSGLSDDKSSSVIGSGSNEDAQLLVNGEPGSIIDAEKRRSSTPLTLDRHKQCCCMCPARLGKICCNSTCGGHTSRGSTFAGSHHRRRPVSMPRLNKTASLRRDTAIERAQAQTSAGRSTR